MLYEGVKHAVHEVVQYLPMESIAERITKARLAKKMKKAELAKLCEVERQSVQDWENGNTKQMSCVALVKAADALGVTEAWLALGREPKLRQNTLQADEAILLEQYRKLGDEDRRAFLRVLRGLQLGQALPFTGTI